MNAMTWTDVLLIICVILAVASLTWALVAIAARVDGTIAKRRTAPDPDARTDTPAVPITPLNTIRRQLRDEQARARGANRTDGANHR